MFDIIGSSLIVHASEAAGKTPQRLFSPKRDEPSVRMLAVAR